jgi:hypothetical protein
MRERQRILQNLETLYQTAFREAEGREDRERMTRLDFDFQRDQLYLEAILDVRDLLVPPPAAEAEGGGVTSILDKAQKLRNLARLR